MTAATISHPDATLETIEGPRLDAPGPRDWVALAACSGKSDLMEPDSAAYDDDGALIIVDGVPMIELIDYSEAIATCDACPVRDACLADAMAWNDVDSGVRGGMTPAQRQSYRRTMRDFMIPHGTLTGYVNYECRCDPCYDAEKAYRADQANPIPSATQNQKDTDHDDELAQLIAEQTAELNDPDMLDVDVLSLDELAAQEA